MNQARKKRILQGNECFSPEELERYCTRYEEFLSKGMEENKHTSGRIAKREEKALLKRLKKYRNHHLLFLYVKIPTGIPETDIQTAYRIGAFFGALFGPIAGGLIAFIGHALSDSIQYGSAWWNWVIASSTSCFIIGLVYPKLRVEDGGFSGKDMIMFNVYQVIANVAAWIVAAISNAISAGVIGTILLTLYSKTRSKKGSLSKS